ncbi:membrane protein [Vibrio campbellii ATCC BAA-1116]|nr:membrane protein [Vibrio campbellii ATCC BAA-1116]
MLIAIRLVKLAVICAVFFTIYDLIVFGEVTWINRFFNL